MKKEKKILSFTERLTLFANSCFPSKKDFAEYLGMSPQHLSAYLNGAREPSKKILEKFYIAGLSLDWLFSGSGEMYAQNARGKILKSRVTGIDSITSDSATSRKIPIIKNIESLKQFDINSLKQLVNELVEEALNEKEKRT